jgi:hypothetical protein
MIPAFEQAKTAHALDGAATVIGFHTKLTFQKYETSMDFLAMLIKTCYHSEVS